MRDSRFWFAATWFVVTPLVGCRGVDVVEVNVAYPLATVHVAAKFDVDEGEGGMKLAGTPAAKPSEGIRVADKPLAATNIVK